MLDHGAGPRTLRLNPKDNVIVAVDGLPPGTTIDGVAVTGRVLKGHKMAVARIAKGERATTSRC
jgi:altronate hydrolase